MKAALQLRAAPIRATALSPLDRVRRCWGDSFAAPSPAMLAYHDAEWGRAALDPRALFKQLILQTFQCGLSWATILNKAATFEARFARYDYAAVAQWGEADIAAALADPGIVRNAAKVRAAVGNARAACALDAASPSGFAAFCWRHCFQLPREERLVQLGSRSGSHMRASERADFSAADGVHPTLGVQAAAQAFRAAGFKFLGPCAMLSFMQAVGAVNHHAPDCAAFESCEAAYKGAAAAAAAAAWGAGAAALPVAAGGAAGAGAGAGALPAAVQRGRGRRSAQAAPAQEQPAPAPKRARTAGRPSSLRAQGE